MPQLKAEKKPRKTRSKPLLQTQSAPQDDFLTWFELPTLNLDRAIHFYSQLFNLHMETTATAYHAMAIFPAEKGIRGALVYGEGCVPSQTGALLYLDAGSDLPAALTKVPELGGQVLMGQTLISESIGSYALILDSEGNRVALFSRPNPQV